MTVALEEFTEWRDSVEGRLGRLEGVSDRHAERFNRLEHVLGSIDEDFSRIQVEFNAQRGMLQALHLTQNEHTMSLAKLEAGQQELRVEHSRCLAGIQAILGLLQSANGSGR